MKNIICNNCVGARLYQFTNNKYKNQFMWSNTNVNDFIYLINNYDNIDFSNIELIEKDDIYYIVIDNKINVAYPHYKKNNDNSEQIIVDNQNENVEDKTLYLPDIEKYIKDKYKERNIRRLSEEPVFLIIDYNYDINVFNKINTKYPVYIFTKQDFNIHNENVKILKNNSPKELRMTGYIAKYILDNYGYIVN